jgi:hypothetical protein
VSAHTNQKINRRIHRLKPPAIAFRAVTSDELGSDVNRKGGGRRRKPQERTNELGLRERPRLLTECKIRFLDLKIGVPCAVGLQERIYGGATAGQKRRLYVSRAREHMWIAKLKRLPGDMCADKEKGTGSRIARIVRQNHVAEFGRHVALRGQH